jgi:hypothetical protein
VAKCSLTDRALEQEHLIGQRHRVAMAQIDLHLRLAFLVDQRVDLKVLLFGELVDIVDEIVELIER